MNLHVICYSLYYGKKYILIYLYDNQVSVLKLTGLKILTGTISNLINVD